MERFSQFQSLHGARVTFGASSGQGHETPESVHFINVTAQPMSGPYGHAIGEPVEVSLALTVPQMAQIIMHFFWDIITRKGVCGQFLRRLMEKRWAVMTSPVAKSSKGGGEWYEQMQYHRGMPGT